MLSTFRFNHPFNPQITQSTTSATRSSMKKEGKQSDESTGQKASQIDEPVDVDPSSEINRETSPSKSKSTEDEPPLSKNQLKKRRRWEKALAIKKRRKEQEREIRLLKAKNEGRDLDQERQQQLVNEQNGKGWERREERWKNIMEEAKIDQSFRVCFDCSFEDEMTWKETNSLSLQLRYTYAMNRKSRCPVYIDVCSLKKGGDTRKHLEKVEGFPDTWVGRAFRCYEGGLDAVYGCGGDQASTETTKNKLSITDNTNKPQEDKPKLPPNHKIVYLTGDSSNTLTTLDNNTTYVIGGIVDRNRLKRAAIERAESLNITTARLPLDECLNFKGSTRVLTCNHVFEILLKYRENGYTDWRGAVLSVLPSRKEVEDHSGHKEKACGEEVDVGGGDGVVEGSESTKRNADCKK
jgi:tRNA (guanine9-N1)-methyltransferase